LIKKDGNIRGWSRGLTRVILDKDGNKIGKENIKEVILRMDTTNKNETDNDSSKNSSASMNKTIDASPTNKSVSLNITDNSTVKNISVPAN
jgi:hypothetical protein